MVRHRLTAAAVALAVALAVVLLAGSCDDGDPEPRFSPSPSASTSSVAGTPTSPVTSGSATPAAETPEEFIRRWIVAYNAYEKTGKAGDFARLSGADCSGCTSISSTIDNVYDAGGFIESNGWSLGRVHEVSGADQPVITADIEVSASRYKESRDAPVQTSPAATVKCRFALRPSDAGWQVISFERLAS